MTDEELVLLARQGDPDAYDQLVVRHQAVVYRTALAAMRSPADAEEVAQDAFLRAWHQLHRFRGDSSFRTWLLTIAWNRAMSRRRSLAGWLRRATTIDEVAEPVGTLRRQDDEVQDGELMHAIRQAIRALSPRLRDALLLAQTGEHRYEEIAVMLAIPVGTVKWRVSEARKQVRASLTAKGYVDAR